MSAKKKEPDPTGLSLEALQSRSEKLAHWIGENPVPILGSIGVVLVIALVVGLIGSSQETSAQQAANQLAAAQRAYRIAMGADPVAVDIPEPANPEAARQARETGIEQLQAVIDEHAGTPMASLAALEQGDLLVGLGHQDEAIEGWETSAQRATGPLQGMLLQRAAAETEASGKLSEAAALYARAGEIADYPLRHLALAESARTRAAAGETEAAVALLQQLEADAPDFVIPEHIASQLRELRAMQSE